jgi:hypothetical protein
MDGKGRAFASLAVASFIALIARCRSAFDHVATKEYRVFVLSPEGHILDQHTLRCADDDEARETAKVLAESNPVEIWTGPVRVVRLEPRQWPLHRISKGNRSAQDRPPEG